jgi:RimJ/RimL family protein N-acetyltransferase
MPETLYTPRLRLEVWSDGHADFLVEISARPEVMRYIGAGVPWSGEIARDLAAHNGAHWKLHGFGWRPAYLADGDRPIGFAMLAFAGEGAGIAAREYEIGWWLAPEVWHRGLGAEAAAAIRDEAFSEAVGAPSVVARIQPGNRPSLAVAAAIGLTVEGGSRGRGGEPIDVLRLTREAWAAGGAF